MDWLPIDTVLAASLHGAPIQVHNFITNLDYVQAYSFALLL